MVEVVLSIAAILCVLYGVGLIVCAYLDYIERRDAEAVRKELEDLKVKKDV